MHLFPLIMQCSYPLPHSSFPLPSQLGRLILISIIRPIKQWDHFQTCIVTNHFWLIGVVAKNRNLFQTHLSQMYHQTCPRFSSGPDVPSNFSQTHLSQMYHQTCPRFSSGPDVPSHFSQTRLSQMYHQTCSRSSSSKLYHETCLRPSSGPDVPWDLPQTHLSQLYLDNCLRPSFSAVSIDLSLFYHQTWLETIHFPTYLLCQMYSSMRTDAW